MRIRVAVVSIVLAASLAGAASGAGAPGPDSGLIIFTARWVTSLDWDPQHEDPPDVTAVVCGVDLTGRTYRLTKPDVWSGPPSGPKWAPDGIHYAATYTGHVPGLTTYGIDIDGLDGTAHRGPSGVLESWSPDGVQLAYHLPNSNDVAVSAAAGNGQYTRIGIGTDVSWSPNGAELAISRADGIHLVRVDRTSDRLLLPNASQSAWSSDGTAIAVRTDTGLAVANADGGALHELGIAGARPVWSPSGTRLAYIAVGTGDIAVANADGSGRQILYSGDAGYRIDWQPVPRPELVDNLPPCVIAPPPDVHTILGSKFDDNIWGTPGADTIDAEAGNDIADGGRGNDAVQGGPGNDELGGGFGDDVLDGGPGSDFLEGGAGNDLIRSRDGVRDSVSCGAGRDTVIADAVDFVAADCERIDGGDVLRNDNQAPAVDAGGPATQQNVMNGRGSYGVTVYGHDDGSGVARIWIERDGHVVVASRSGSCRKTTETKVRHGRICSPNLQLSLKIDTSKLRSGYHTFRVHAVDAAGNSRTRYGWEFQIDRRGPRARRLDTWFYDHRLHTAWIQIYSGDPGGSGAMRFVNRYRVNDGAWTRWIDPDAGQDTATPVVEAHDVLPGDVVHTQIRETDFVGNVGPVVSLSTRVRGTEDNLTDLPLEPSADGPPVALVTGAAVRAGFARGNDNVPVRGTGESYAGTVLVSLEEAGSGRTFGQATCSAKCPYSLSVGASIDTSQFPEGVVSLIARARDANGKEGVSEGKVELAIDKTPPASPRITSCRWLPARGRLALKWAAADPPLRGGVPGSSTATIRWRYRTGTKWSPWLINGDGHGLMRTLYAPTRNATVEAIAIDSVGNESAASTASCHGRP
jgi:hypothetical protein